MENPTLQEVLVMMRQHRGREPKDEIYREWEKHFEEYNKDHPDKTLGMGCIPCYSKVFLYLRDKQAL